ncbi:MAG: UDP-N-acetylmuramate dehydrogenase [Desulforhopalus sp.]|nr:UDP-N-acetylmuramate dehydrogenase [Desulforhopalus sp.]
MNPAQRQALSALLSQPVQWQCHLSGYTSFAIGGPAEALIKVNLRSELQPLLAFLAEEDISWRVLGKGTNLLVGDEGFAGVIIRLGGEFTQCAEEAGEDGLLQLQIGGGASLSRLAVRYSERGLTGLEFACGIPGTLGGAVIMNAGAWGSDIASVLQGVTLTTAEGDIPLTAEEMDFTYRSWRGFSRYQGRAVVAAVGLRLRHGDPVEVTARCRTLQERRKVSQPSDYANAGSFFKNPPNDSAGRLIEASGLKGLRVGGAMVSERHANFLVNTGSATAADVLRLMTKIQKKVQEDWGVCLEPEVHFI